MATEEPVARAALPDQVLTFGGAGGRTYHRIAVDAEGEIQPECRQHGRNPLRKERAVIESHYSPCPRCFPDETSDS